MLSLKNSFYYESTDNIEQSEFIGEQVIKEYDDKAFEQLHSILFFHEV